MAKKATFNLTDDADNAKAKILQKHPEINLSASVSHFLVNLDYRLDALTTHTDEFMSAIVTPADLNRLAREKRDFEIQIETRGFEDGSRWAAKEASWVSLEAISDIDIPDQVTVDDVWPIARRIARSADPLDEGQEWFGDDREVSSFWGDRVGDFCADGDIRGLLEELGVDYLRNFVRGTRAVYERVEHAA